MSNVVALKLPSDALPSLVKRTAEETLDDVRHVANKLADLSARLRYLESCTLELQASDARKVTLSAIKHLRESVRSSLVDLANQM